ncbi:MAG: hypothetical protein V7739_01175 [Motiliproteus sp.]
MNESSYLSPRILDTALKLAENQSWETIRLDDIHAHYAQKEDLIDAWFDRADQVMLQQAATPEFLALSPHERLETVIMSWMEDLADHHKATQEMILGRLKPGHLHIQWAGLPHVSRTLQWMCEAAHRDASYLNRALEETVLTSIYLLTFGRWLTDESDHFQQTRRQLRSLIKKAGFILHLTERERDCPVPPLIRKAEEQGSTGTHH